MSADTGRTPALPRELQKLLEAYAEACYDSGRRGDAHLSPQMDATMDALITGIRLSLRDGSDTPTGSVDEDLPLLDRVFRLRLVNGGDGLQITGRAFLKNIALHEDLAERRATDTAGAKHA